MNAKEALGEALQDAFTAATAAGLNETEVFDELVYAVTEFVPGSEA